MDWGTLIKTIIGAGVGTALVQPLLAIYRDARERNSHAAYMAMRLAVILEAYTAACSDLIAKNSTAEAPPDQEFPNWDTTLPQLLSYPEDAEGWRAIDRKLAGRCLNLRNKIDGSQTVIRWIIEYTRDELGDVLDEEAARRGLEAWSIAIDLRRKHGIEQADAVWDYAEGLKQTLHHAEKARADRSRENAASMKDFLPPQP